MSDVRCQVSCFFVVVFLEKVVELVGGGSVITRGLPHLVFLGIIFLTPFYIICSSRTCKKLGPKTYFGFAPYFPLEGEINWSEA